MAIIAAFEEEELNRLYTEVAKGGPVLNTGIVGNAAGTQQRNVNLYDAVRRWEIQYGGMSQDEKLKLEEFFLMKWGRAIGFRFYPPSDRNFRDDVLGVAAAGNTTFYLKRNYRSRSRFYSQRITKPVKGTVVITVGGYRVPIYNDVGIAVYPAGTEPTLNLPCTIDWDTGKVTFDNAPATGNLVRAARGEYDRPVYFDVDQMDANDYGVFADWESVPVIEILPSQITTDGTAATNSLSLAFTFPHSGQEVNDRFDITLTHTNVSHVYLYRDGMFLAADNTAPFSFASVSPASTPGEFELLAVGVNDTTGEIVEARIYLTALVTDTTPPAAITDLTASASLAGTITVDFTPPIDA